MINNGIVENIKSEYLNRSTKELMAIWKTKGTPDENITEEGFEAIRQILNERHFNIPPQPEPVASTNPFDMRIDTDEKHFKSKWPSDFGLSSLPSTEPQTKKRFEAATVPDILLSIIIPFAGVLIGLWALVKGEKKRALTMILISVCVFVLYFIYNWLIFPQNMQDSL
jgi:hypothetical protein